MKSNKNSTAAGPNGITMLHLKNHGHFGLRHLTYLANLSAQKANIPAIWKSAHILLILKPGKLADEAGFYCPIALLCLKIKVIERMNLGALKASLPTVASQYTALLPNVWPMASMQRSPRSTLASSASTSQKPLMS